MIRITYHIILVEREMACSSIKICKLTSYKLSLFVASDPDTGETALHVAVSHNSESIVLQLMELGASLDPQDKEGLTPVMTACQYGHLQALEKLGAKGITAKSEDRASGEGRTWCMAC